MSTTAPAAEHDAGVAAMAAELGEQTALLHDIAGSLVRGDHLEDVQTFVIPTGAASAFVFDPAVPQHAEVEIEAWQSGSAAIVVLDGSYTEAQAAAQLPASGYAPTVLLSVPSAGRAQVKRAQYSGHLTILCPTAPAAACLITVRIRASERS